MTDIQPLERNHSRARIPYARILAVFCPVVLAIMILTFLLYIAGTLPPFVAIANIPHLWVGSAADALRETGIESGWGWVRHWSRGDMLCVFTLALLSMGSPIACAASMIQYARRGEVALAVIACVQVLILFAAMSGLIVVHV